MAENEKEYFTTQRYVIKGGEKIPAAPGYHGYGTAHTIPRILHTNARKVPNKEAIIDALTGEVMTHSQYYRECCKVGNMLLDLGLKKTDHIAWESGERIWTFELYGGPMLAGITQTPINYRFTADEIVTQMSHSEPKVILFQEDYAEVINAIRDRVPSCQHYIIITTDKRTEAPPDTLNYWALKEKASDEDPRERVDEITPEDLFIIIYTAGTTGYPKGIMHSHGTLIADQLFFINSFRYAFETRLLWLMPLYHWGGYCPAMGTISMGGTVIISTYEPERVWEAVEKYKINSLLMAPSMWIMSLAVPEFKKRYNLFSLKSLATAAAPMPSTTLKTIVEAFPDAELHDCYTSTEQTFTTTYKDLMLKYERNVGVPWFNHEISIRDYDDRIKELPDGEVGVIYGRGPGTHLGYYKNDEENKRTFTPDGWQTSEDTGYIDPETKLLFLFDRSKDVINTGGEVVSSVEVEQVVLQHPAVFEAAVIGIPDEKWQEKVHAVVTLKPGMKATPKEIEEFCKGKIAGFKRPKSVDIIEALPKNPVGKVLKRELREPYWKGLPTRIG